MEDQRDVDAQQRAIFKTLLYDFELWVANRDIRQSYYTQAEQLKQLIAELKSWADIEVHSFINQSREFRPIPFID